ncbi:MAG: DctP family TRAP transporter solute-binding subunit [Aeromonadales bacterium]|nr:DctP family TRAP transporter solute-binding subunit [Aeromonadales bacterium]MDY2890152.1 DctP family TRAP transporter solute-binding subunit [Succinivibrio sp.]
MKNKGILAMAAAVIMAVASSQALASDTITTRFSNATNQAAKDAAVAMIDTVTKESGGKLKIEHFPDNMLGDDRVATESTIMGDIGLVLTQPSVMTTMVHDAYAWDAPFLFNDEEQAEKCLNSPLASKINDQIEKKNLKVLAFLGNGFRNFTNNKVPVRVPADVKGMKVRVIESDIMMAQWKAWGANPTPMAFAEVLPALQQGTIDAQENPLPIIDSNKLYEVQHYISLTGHQYSEQILLMNKELFDSLDDQCKKALLDGVEVFKKVHRETTAKLNADSIAKFKKAGCEVVDVTPEQREQWRKMAIDKGVYDVVRKKMDHPEYLDEILNGKF